MAEIQSALEVNITIYGVEYHRKYGVEQNKEINEEHDEGCVEEGFQLARAKFDRYGKRYSQALGVWYRSFNI